jgi:hypothetical protein
MRGCWQIFFSHDYSEPDADPMPLTVPGIVLRLIGLALIASPGCSQETPTPAPLLLPHDDVGSAQTIAALPFLDAVNTADATTAADDPDDCVGTGPTVWYRFVPTSEARVSATTFGSGYDTGLSVYAGTRGRLVPLACNDDAGGGRQSRVMVGAAAGETLYFMVGAFASGPGGDLVFDLDLALPTGR